eukprot:TRINITY_DN20009_c0_g2_i2.p1 TRINITY_DN20009_c0_g2~~TRINITY_DN20009_c0_g2_i2.p1  ORF type:complete len:2825 (-),score=233.62 TRINITY_DN20009_c0_g2_i2:4128-12602(-)
MFSSVVPSTKLSMSYAPITLTGAGFFPSDTLNCRFRFPNCGNSSIEYPGTYKSPTTVVCGVSPLYVPCSGVIVELTFNGVEYFLASSSLVYTDVPQVHSLVPPYAIYDCIFYCQQLFVATPKVEVKGARFAAASTVFANYYPTGVFFPATYIDSSSVSTTLATYGKVLDPYNVSRVTINVFNQDDNIGISKAAFYYSWKPIITSMSPLSGPSAGGTTIRVRGKHFMNTTTIRCFIGTYESAVAYVSTNEVQCITSAVPQTVFEGVIALNFDGFTNITFLGPTGQPQKLFYYHNTIEVFKVTPSFSLISATNIDIVLEAKNVIPMHDNLKCKIGQYIASAKNYVYNPTTGIAKITCNIPTYRSTIGSWDYTSDIVVSADVSNNGIDFSNSNVKFMFVNQLTLVTGIGPYRGPITAGSTVFINLRVPIAVADYGPICRFGDAVVPAILSSPSTLSCSTLDVFGKISPEKLRCYKDTYCAVNSTFELQGNSYTFPYSFYMDPRINSLLPPCSGGSTAPILVRGSDMFNFFENPLAKFTLNSDSEIVVCQPVDYNNTIQCVPPTDLINSYALPVKTTVEVSVNSGVDWSNNAKSYTVSKEDEPVSLDAVSGPSSGNTKLTINYENIFSHEDEEDYEGYRCHFSTAANTEGFVVPAKWDNINEKIYCITPAKNVIDGTTEGVAEVAISSNGVTFSSKKLQFKYYKEATFTQIDSPYLLIDLSYQKRVIGTFPQSDATTIVPKILLEAVGTTRSQILDTTSYSTTEITFVTISGIFESSDTVQLSISFNNGFNFQPTPFVLKSILSAALSSATPSIVHLATASTAINLIGQTFYSAPLYCLIDSSTKVPATRITSKLVLCHLPGKTVEASSTVTLYLEDYPYTYSSLEVSHNDLPVVQSIMPTTLYAGKPYNLILTGSGYTGATIFVKLADSVYPCDVQTDEMCTVKFDGSTERIIIPMVSLNANYFETIAGIQLTVLSCGEGYVCPTSFNEFSDPVQCPKGYECKSNEYSRPCPPGYYQDQTGGSVCQNCLAGKYCPSIGTISPQDCPDGFLCSTSKIGFKDEMQICPEGFYCPKGTSSFDRATADTGPNTMKSCPSGYWCGFGTVSLNTIYGRFNTAQNCNDGIACTANSIDQTGTHTCKDGHYCIQGNEMPCGPGSYCPEQGMTQPVPCPPGLFNTDNAQTYCRPCPLGTLCSLSGATYPLKCTPGFVCSFSGQVLPTALCPGGKYCEGGTATSLVNSTIPSAYKPKLCSAGTYCLRGTRTNEVIPGDAGAAQICMAGIYCEEGSDGPEGQGYCAEGYYCPLNSKPIPADPGYFASGKGNVKQEPCPPGTYSSTKAASECTVCPAGYYCPNEAMQSPIICPPGTYKEEDRNTIYCRLCPEGTWSNRTGLVTVVQCTTCGAGIVCDKEGITDVETQARRCPEGYICGDGTTSSTENDNPCPAGYWCSKGTGHIRELHVCSKGYYCTKGTTESGRFYNKCPRGYYCPKGTAANVTEEGNITGLWIVTNTELYEEVIRAKKEWVGNATNGTIEDADLQPDTSCEEDSALPTYLKENYAWLKCPPGTISERGSWCLGHCIKDSTLLEEQSIIDPIGKGRRLEESKSLSWNKVVDSLKNYTLKPLEYVKVTFDFENLPEILKYNEVYVIELYDGMNKSQGMPNYFDSANNNITNKKTKLQIRILNSSPDEKVFKIAIKLLDGLYLPYISAFKDTVTVNISSPSRAEHGSNKLFGIFLHHDSPTSTTLTLPYNLRDFSVDMYTDMTSATEDVSLAKKKFERDPFDITLWDSKSVTTIALPWLPFFGGCKGQDRRILLYDLLENPEKCSVVPSENTVVVSSLPTSGFYPNADSCETALECHYEENLNVSVANSIRWYQISSPTTLFYISSVPISPTELFATSPENDLESGFEEKFEGQSDYMVPVVFHPTQMPDEGVPSVVELEIFYKQVNKNKKTIVKAVGRLLDYSKELKEEAQPKYKLRIKYSPMNYFELIDSFQFGPSVYALLFCMVSVALLILVAVFWALNLLAKQVGGYLTLIRLKHVINVTFMPPIIGGALATIPVIMGLLCVYWIIAPKGMLYQSSAEWDTLAEDLETEAYEMNRRGRVGLGLCILAVVFLHYGASMLIAIPDESEEDKIKETVVSRVIKEKEMEEEEGKGLRGETGNLESEIKKWQANDLEQRTEELMAARDMMIYKKSHFFLVCLVAALILLIELEFSYTSIFRNNIGIFLTVFMLHDLALERLLTNVVLGEALLVTPIMGAFVLIHLIMILTSGDFEGYLYSYFIQSTVLVIARIYLNPVLERIESWVLKLTIYLSQKSAFFQKLFRKVLIRNLLAQSKLQSKAAQLTIGENDVSEGMESVLKNVSLFTTQTQALLMSPVAMFLIINFADETRLPENYQISKTNLSYYFIFYLVLLLPQLLMNIFMLHSLEIIQGIRLFDYFTFAAYRYKTRTTSWVNEHWPLDRSIPHAWRSLDQMCFSSQFYFMITIASWGIIVLLMGLTIMIRNEYTVFSDPYLTIFILVIFGIYVLSAFLLREFCKMIQLWEVSKRDSEKHALKLGMCPLDHFNNERILIDEMQQEVFKVKFLGKNKEWLIHNLKTIIDKNDVKGIEVYQDIINEGARQEEMKNAGAKAKRNRAMLPYNKDRGEENVIRNERLEISDVREEDYPSIDFSPNPLLFSNHNGAPYRVFRKWFEKTQVAIRYQNLIADVPVPQEARCKICQQKERLQVDHLRPFYQIYRQYLRETIGMPFDPDHWRVYYIRHQRFKTVCADCEYVNNVMKSKLVQYKYTLKKKMKENAGKLFKSTTLQILNLWKLTAQSTLEQQQHSLSYFL